MKTPSHKSKHRASIAGLLFVLAGMVVPGPQTFAAEELGRLFFTPERRQILDRQRQLNIQEKQEIPEDPTLTINGVVTRSSGKRTVWINGMAQNEKDKWSGITVTPNRNEPGKVVVHTEESPTGKAKVGDTVNRNTGESTDLLNGGSITLTRKRNASEK